MTEFIMINKTKKKKPEQQQNTALPLVKFQPALSFQSTECHVKTFLLKEIKILTSPLQEQFQFKLPHSSSCSAFLTGNVITEAGIKYFSFPVQNASALHSPLSIRHSVFGSIVIFYTVSQVWDQKQAINNFIVK